MNYVYAHFYEKNCHKFLIDIQPWIAFIKEQNLKNPSLPVLDWQGTLFNDILECTVDVIYNVPANSLKLAQIQADKAQRTVKGTQSLPATSFQTSFTNNLSTNGLTSSLKTGGTPDPQKTPSPLSSELSSPDASPDRMPSL